MTKTHSPTIHAIDRDFRPRVHPGLIVDESEWGVFLLHPFEPRWAMTNPSGVSLVSHFRGNESIGEIARRITREFPGQDPGRIESDLLAFVRQLHEANLLANLPAPAPPKAEVEKEVPRLTLYITEECNLRCRHCFVVEGKMPAPAIEADEVRSLIEDHLARYPGALITFSGGEALLRRDCLELLRFSRERTPHVILNTNGLLIDSEMARELSGLDIHIQISLDGADPEVHDAIRGKGTFDRTWKTLELLCAAGMARRIRMATALTRCAVSQVKKLVDAFEALGVYETRFLALNRLRAAETHWEKIVPDTEELLAVYRYLLLELPHRDPPPSIRVEGDFPGFVPNPDPGGRHWCPIGETTIIDSQGNAYGCPMLHVPEYRLGNIYEESLEDIQKGEKARELRQKMLRRRYVIEECATCSWRNFCQGGCQAFSQLRTGTVWAADEFCDFRRELYRRHASHEASSGS